jgi:transmembrane sensor
VRLADGSTVTLNALSEIRVRLSKRERAIDLLSGQALFRVAKDKNRPFIVASGDNSIRAVGTQFDVNQKSSATIVTVVEGRVAVLSQESTSHAAVEALNVPPSIEVGAGEQVRLTSDRSLPRPHGVNVASATGWTQQLLIFESTPLPEVAEEFNRFNTRQLIVDDAALVGFNVSGMFPALDPASLPRLLAFLREQPGIQVTEQGNRIFVRQK